MNDDAEVADVETTAQAPPAAMSFDGRRGELAGLLFRNLLLTLATLGIYRFWANTRVRGFLWRHVKLLDEPLEYLGNGTELLIGFLIAVVIIAPLTTVLSWLPPSRRKAFPTAVCSCMRFTTGALDSWWSWPSTGCDAID